LHLQRLPSPARATSQATDALAADRLLPQPRLNTLNSNDYPVAVGNQTPPAYQESLTTSPTPSLDNRHSPASDQEVNAIADSPLHARRRQRTHVLLDDDDMTEPPAKMHKTERSNEVKLHKRRWTEDEKCMLFREFGRDITEKTMPSGKRLTAIARKLSNGRTVAQLRTQIHNYISGKTRIA
jgi:hypothetical protein